MVDHGSKEYISLFEAAKHCRYSQAYLSLRARQGKLKAVKFGRNWMTRKEWVDEYCQSASNMPLPKNLPVLRFGFVLGLVFVLLSAEIVFYRDGIYKGYQELDKYMVKLNGAVDLGAGDLKEEKLRQLSWLDKTIVLGLNKRIDGFFTNFVVGFTAATQEIAGASFGAVSNFVAAAAQVIKIAEGEVIKNLSFWDNAAIEINEGLDAFLASAAASLDGAVVDFKTASQNVHKTQSK